MKHLLIFTIILMSFSLNAQEFIGYKLDKYYVNDNLYNKLKDEKTTYHKNGKVKLQVSPYEESKDLLLVESFDSEGLLIKVNFVENKFDKPIWVSKNGNEFEVDNYMGGSFIPNSVKFPTQKSLVTHFNGVKDEYFGTLTSGAYYIGDRYRLSGVFSPLILSIGNGTTVFVEDLLKEKYYWAIVVNSKIVMAYPAQKSEKPSVEELNKIETDYYNIIRQKFLMAYSPYGHKYKKKHKVYNSQLSGPYSVAEINTPNIHNHNGYGVKTELINGITLASYRKVQVGNFKNGQLHGIGYECAYTMKEGFTGNIAIKDKLILEHTLVELKYGVFKDGIFSEGFENNNDLVNNQKLDFWQPTAYENVKYTNISKKIYNIIGNDKPEFYFKNNEPLTLSSISTKDQIYIFSLNRLFNIHKVDNNKKEILLQSDVEGKYFVINGDGITTSSFAKAKFLVVKYELINTTTVCRTTVKVPIIEKVAKKVTSTQRSYIGSHSYTKGGVTYTYAKQPDISSSSTIYEDQLIGYRDETCPQCKGTGIMPFVKDVKNGYLFDFDTANINKKEQTENNSTKIQPTSKQVKTETYKTNSTQSFYAKKIIAIPQGKNQHIETKAVLLEKENYMISKGLSFDEKNTEYVKLFDELYTIDKYRAYRLIMAIDNQYVRTTMDKFTAEQKLFLREYSREQVKGVQVKK